MTGERRRILVVAHTGRADTIEAAVRVSDALSAAGATPVMDAEQWAELGEHGSRIPMLEVLGRDVALDEVELAIVLGGDGTILRAAELTRGSAAPILGINMGHVGFLAESERDD